MPTHAEMDGVSRELTGWPVAVDGIARQLDSKLAVVDGVQREIFANGQAIGGLAEGDIVRLKVGAEMVDFFVAKHDYESGLNGAGRTLLVQKTSIGDLVWNSGGNNAYAGSDIDNYLSNDYVASLDPAVRTAIGMTTFYFIPGNGDISLATLSRLAFLLSEKEVYGFSTGGIADGTKLPIADLLQSTISGWHRTPNAADTTQASYGIGTFGPSLSYCHTKMKTYPAFTLPSNWKL